MYKMGKNFKNPRGHWTFDVPEEYIVPKNV